MAAFIVFEGGDGSGKSTQARALFRRLQQEGYPAIMTHEPGGTAVGESLRRWLKNRQGLSSMSELFLFLAARAQLVETVIRPALTAGTSVICDRYIASTVAYQGYGRGLDLALIQQLNQAATGGLAPDLTVFLDLPPVVGLDRISRTAAAQTGDIFDTAPLEFHRQVREGYLAQAAQNSTGWLVLDAARPREELARTIWAKVQPLL